MRVFKKFLNKFSKVNKNKILKGYSTDGKAAVFTLGFAYLFLIIEIVYKLKIKKELPTFELILIFLMFALFGLLKKFFTNPSCPKKFDGSPLPAGSSKKSKEQRNKYYKLSAVLYASVFSLVIFLALTFSSNILGVNLAVEFFAEKELPNIIIALIGVAVVFPVSYIFAYMIDFLWYENLLSNIKNQSTGKMPDKKDYAKPAKANNNAENLPDVPKRRGRPPKAKTEDDIKNIKSEVKQTKSTENITAVPKKRGRPKKVNTEQ